MLAAATSSSIMVYCILEANLNMMPHSSRLTILGPSYKPLSQYDSDSHSGRGSCEGVYGYTQAYYHDG